MQPEPNNAGLHPHLSLMFQCSVWRKWLQWLCLVVGLTCLLQIVTPWVQKITLHFSCLLSQLEKLFKLWYELKVTGTDISIYVNMSISHHWILKTEVAYFWSSQMLKLSGNTMYFWLGNVKIIHFYSRVTHLKKSRL